MPYRPPARRTVSITLNPLQLIGCIALGLWLGFVAIALTAWLLSRLLPATQLAPLADVVRPATQAAPVAAQPAADNPMFEQYKSILNQQARQEVLEQARNDPRNQTNPTCQFWLQQDRTIPSDKSRSNVLQFCN